jgi:hypothetical protein
MGKPHHEGNKKGDPAQVQQPDARRREIQQVQLVGAHGNSIDGSVDDSGMPSKGCATF